jgi:bifunctional UDP-N-acetylglucosamine pyrophosphorylase/glucosamine-1-phosphate N-acetyltransferase
VEAIVPAAGRGTRLGSTRPKFLYPVGGRPILSHLLDRLRGLVSRAHIVVSPEGAEFLREWPADPDLPVSSHTQHEPTGMADAVLAAAALLHRLESPPPETVLIVWGDQIGLGRDTIARTLDAHRTERPQPVLTFPVVSVRDPYVHYETDPSGRILAVRQAREGDVMPRTGLADCGCFVAEASTLFDALVRARSEGALRGARTGEMNFLPVVPWLARTERVVAVRCARPRDVIGINTPDDAARLGASPRSS